MTITVTTQVHDVNIHHASDMIAMRAGSTAWLNITTTRGERANIFMDFDMASEIADLWKHMNQEPEPVTFDEALAAICDAEARTDEARKLRGMV